MSKLQRYIFLSLLTAAALILSIIEGMIPLPYIAPGAKLGLSNIITLTIVVVFGFKDALLVVILRCILLMLVATNPITFIYSIASGIMSTVVMCLGLKYFKRLSLIGISVLGAMTHNATQVTVAAILFETFNLYYYLPILSLVSIFTGCFVGYTTIFMSDNLSKTVLKLGREV
ncbi:MAG: Gx transporter family protein [Sedimentibacter sp.]|uniref:Gx transporter family protein n=1 Tax=Sedimentibacter sp. TaxID=1960295 RepID=UPI002981947B|nr:Gx transporter family protein [Sedimentibacter sp.]MDW5300205.1 Gx transporter family protein [Sedimentibacter sp.]